MILWPLSWPTWRFAIYPVRAYDTYSECWCWIWLEDYRWRDGRREFFSLNY